MLATPAFAGDVTLEWDANSEPDIQEYRFYLGNSSRNYGPPVTVGNQTSHTASNLTPGTYFFAVTAVNLAGLESGFSNEVSATVNSSTGCDVNSDGSINVLDLQVMTNTILGSGPCPGNCDINSSGSVDALDVQLLVNIVLGVGSCPQ